MSLKVKKILRICEENELEIVSFGLAPNPWGFCYEGGRCEELDRLLNSLTEKEENELKREVFK